MQSARWCSSSTASSAAYHNHAFETWCGRDASDWALSLGGSWTETSRRACLARPTALLGTPVEYETYWPHPDGGRRVLVKLLPYPTGAQTTSGFYVFVTPPGPRADADEAHTHPVADGAAVYLDAMQEQLPTQTDPREFLLKAIDEDQFLLLEQPIEPLAPDTTSSKFREILLRLRDHDERTLRPGGFLEVAAHYGLMPAIDRWVSQLLRSAAAALDADPLWRMPLYAVNLSERRCAQRFAHHVRAQPEHGASRATACVSRSTSGPCAARERRSVLMAELSPLAPFAIDGFGATKVLAAFRKLRFEYGRSRQHHRRDPPTRPSREGALRSCSRVGIGVRTIAQRSRTQAPARSSRDRNRYVRIRRRESRPLDC